MEQTKHGPSRDRRTYCSACSALKGTLAGWVMSTGALWPPDTRRGRLLMSCAPPIVVAVPCAGLVAAVMPGWEGAMSWRSVTVPVEEVVAAGPQVPYRAEKSWATRRMCHAHRRPSAVLPKDHSFRAKSRSVGSDLPMAWLMACRIAISG